MIRLSTSRPKRSVPSGFSQAPPSIHTGGISFLVMSASLGSCGASAGANTAASTSAPRVRPGNQGRCLRGVMTDPRVEIAVEQVHEEIAREIERAQHQDACLHDRIVAHGDALEDEPSQA